MKTINTILILAAAFLAVFLQVYLTGLRNILGVQIDLLPGLMVYAALHGGLRAVALLAVLGGLCFDSLSANPAGISILPLFIIGYVVYRKSELILRDLTFAQFIIGLAASLAAPLLTLLLLFTMGESPLVGWGTIWQVLIMALTGGALTPVCFRFFRWLRRAYFHPPMTQTSFRPDREIQRGRF